jgi:hypothetical protein
VSHTFEAAEDQRQAVSVGQGRQFVVQHLLEIAPGVFVDAAYFWQFGVQRFMPGAPAAPCLCIQGSASGDAEEPVGQLLAAADGVRLSAQNEKGCLKAIFGILLMMHESLTDAPDHRTMAPQKRRKCGFILLRDELMQQLLIGRFRERAGAERSSQAAENSLGPRLFHLPFL